MTLQSLPRLLPFFIFSFILGIAAHAQTAQVTGQIADATGAVIPGAEVTITNVETGFNRKAASNDEGYYTVPLLPPGNYRITVQKEGFKPIAQENTRLAVEQTARLDFTMETGNVNEQVTITGNEPVLSPETSSLGTVVDNQKITSIPLNGRSPFRLVQLTPGVISSPSTSGQFGDIPVNTTWDTNFSINGGRNQSNEVLIDGVPSTAGFFNQITTIPSVEATREFKVQSNNVSAEYGRFAGGVVNVTTQSGGNDFHGTLFEFLRNNAFDANDFFNNRAGKAKPPFHMNQFGGSIGGPIYLPRFGEGGKAFLSGRGRTFFFTDYQGTRWRRGDVFIGRVPTLAERNGDFSNTRDANGNLITIYNTIVNAQGQFVSRVPFAGNRLPQSRIDPIAAQAVQFYPLPNAVIPGSTDNFVSNAGRSVDADAFSLRIDHKVSERYQLFGRFSRNVTNLAQPDYFGNVASPDPGAVGTTPFRQSTFAFDNTITLGPTSVLNLRYGFARWFQSRVTRSFGFDQTTLGLPTSLVSQFQVPVFPLINAQDYLSLAGQSFLRNGNDTHSFIGSVTTTRGQQTLRYGAELRVRRINFFSVQAPGGTYNFTRAFTARDPNNTTLASGGSGLASFLLGYGSGGSVPINSAGALQNFYYGGYIQDDIKVTPKLTVNLGLRYETETPYTERYNRLVGFDFAAPSPARNFQFPNLTGALFFAGVDSPYGRRVYRWDKNNIAPRVGFAYSPYEKMVVRGGFGLFYAPLEISNNAVGFVPQSGFGTSTAFLGTLDTNRTPFNTLRNPYPTGLNQPAGSSLGASTFLGQGITVWDPDATTPYYLQYNLDVQRELPGSILAEVSYAGSRGVHLTRGREFDALNPSFLSLGTGLQSQVANPFFGTITTGALAQRMVQRRQLLLPFPQFTSINVINNTSGQSSYNSLQAKLDKRLSQGFNFLLSYTFSKFISDVNNQLAPIGGDTNVSGVQNFYDLRSERSLSELDVPHSLAFSFVAELPIGPNRRYLSGTSGALARIVEGIQFNGVARYQSGFPLVLTASNTTAGGGTRPNRTGQDPNLPADRSRDEKIRQWFNTAAFAAPPAFTFGDAPPTLPNVRGPSFRTVDFSVIKNTRLSEGTSLQFRSEFFNVFNFANFAGPITNINSTQFGQITRSRSDALPRVIQFALKLTF